MKKLLAVAVLASGMIFFAGCKTEFNENDVEMKNVKNFKVNVEDKNLAEDFHVFHTGTLKTETGVTGIGFRSRMGRSGFFRWLFCTGKKYDLEYRVVWYKADGKEAPSKDGYPWKKILLRDGQEFAMSFFAPAPEAVSAVFFIRPVAVPATAPAAKKNVKKEDKAAKAPAVKIESKPAAASPAASAGTGDTVSAAQLKKQVETLRSDISKQIKTDGDEPGVSITEKEARKSGEQVMSSNVAGKDKKSVSSTAENIAKPAAQLQKEQKAQAAGAACLCGCGGKADAQCYCGPDSNCPAAQARKAKKQNETKK